MAEWLSRVLLGLEMILLGVPTAFIFILPLVVPAAIMLPAIFVLAWFNAVFGAGADGHWTEGLEVLGMGLLSLCATAAVICLFGLAGVFLVRGRQGLRGQRRLIRFGLVSGVPPLLLSSLPRLFEALAARPIDSDAVAAATLYAGLPLLVPACHLLFEARHAARLA